MDDTVSDALLMPSIQYDKQKNRIRVFGNTPNKKREMTALVSFSVTQYGGKRRAIAAAKKWLEEHPQPHPQRPCKHIYKHGNGVEVRFRQFNFRKVISGSLARAKAERYVEILKPCLDFEVPNPNNR